MNILIIEDETRIAKRIERMTREFFSDSLSSVNRVDELSDALEFIKNNPLDVVLLDLNLNGENGFDILKLAVSESFHTIIISAHKDRAIYAFEYGVLDFIAKPFNQNRLNQAFDRVLQNEKKQDVDIKFLAIKKKGAIELISVEDILYIKGSGVYTEIHLKSSKKELHDKSLEKLEQLLPKSFVRIHKSYLLKIIEMDKLVVKSGSKYTAELNNGEVLPVGRTKYKEIKEQWL
ncbi:MAG: response regulator transcription factor [Flavobacteriaceae bacterium]|nr:response regulator transcription factor [Flavobacteriaceae bacterium]